MNSQVIAFINEALNAGLPVAMAILTESGRDTPGVPGSMMAVGADGAQVGTIGGGAAEAMVAESCQRALGDPNIATLPFDCSLGRDGGLDMLCGGEIRGLITVIRPRHRLLIFGGGHVGQKLYQAALVAGFDVRVIEDRRDFAADYPKEHFVFTNSFHDTARELAAHGGDYIVIVTRGHTHDFDVLSAVAESGAAYIGMIGSRHKVSSLLETLRQQGVSPDALERIYSPVGLEIDNGTPGEIAIGVMAEILAVKNKAELRHCRDRVK